MMTIWLSQHVDTNHSRTLRSCVDLEEFLDCAERWLLANGGLVDYYCPRSGKREVYSLDDIKKLQAETTQKVSDNIYRRSIR